MRPGSIWVRLPRFIGDAVMIHRAVEPLRLKGQELVAWGPAPVVDLFQGSDAFLASVPDVEAKPSAWAMARLLRRHKPKAVVNLPRSQRASTAALLAGVPLRIGWREALGGLINHHSLSFQGTSGHQIERYDALLRLAWPDLTRDPAQGFRPRVEAQEAADALLAGASGPFVALALGAASWNKRLGLLIWEKLAGLLKVQGYEPILLGSAGEDQAMAQALSDLVPGLLDFTGRASLPVTAGLIVRAAGLVGNDSALAHLAAACGIPTVVAFGPTDPRITAPPGARVLLKGGLPCLPCGRMDCVMEGHPCMQTLEAERLLEALLQVMKDKP